MAQPTSTDEGIRLARRRRLEQEVVLRDRHGHGEVRLRCRDISVTGLFVWSQACAPPGIEFDCALPIGDQWVEARGRVTRVNLDAASPGMGIEFTRLPRPTWEALAGYVGSV